MVYYRKETEKTEKSDSMHMKYLQGIADIENHYTSILQEIDNPGRWSEDMLKSWGVNMSEREKIEEEKEVLHYLISCQGDMAHEKKATKPTLEVVNRCFTRHLNFLKEIHDCHAYNVNKHPNKITQREYKTCTHYLFKFSLPAWYKKMPEEVLTFQEKYPDFK